MFAVGYLEVFWFLLGFVDYCGIDVDVVSFVSVLF